MPDPELFPLVARFMEIFFTDVDVNRFTRAPRPEEDQSVLIILGEEADALFREIQSRLPQDTEIRDQTDLLDVVRRLLVRGQDPWADGVLDSAIRNPLSTFRYEVPISAPSDFSFEFHIGGENDLAISTRSSSVDDLQVLVLNGTCTAIGERRALEKVERTVLTVIPLAVASGLAEVGAQHVRPVHATVEGFPYAIDGRVGSLAASTRFVLSVDTQDDISARRLARGQFDEIVLPRLRAIGNVLRSNDSRALPVRSSARLLADALSSGDHGRAVAFALMSMEAALLDQRTSDVLSRLREAVVFRLGATHEERDSIRANVTRLYKTRSKWVHTGSALDSADDHHLAIQLAREVLRRELKSTGEL